MGKFGDGISWDDHVDQVFSGKSNVYYDKGNVSLLAEAVSLISTDTKKDDRKALDCGCHVGRWIDPIMNLGFKYTGVDQSDKALDVARNNKPYGTWVHSFLWDMKFNEEFDFACVVAVLQHNLLAEQERIVPSIFRAIKPGGTFFLTESTMPHTTITQRTHDGWVNLAESCGFKFIKSYHKNEFGLEDHYIFIKERK